MLQSIFQLNFEGVQGTGVQQTNILPMQQFDDASVIIEQMKLQDANECAITEPFLSVEDSNILSDEREQTTIDIYAKDESVPVAQDILKKSLGRPRKTEVILQAC